MEGLTTMVFVGEEKRLVILDLVHTIPDSPVCENPILVMVGKTNPFTSKTMEVTLDALSEGAWARNSSQADRTLTPSSGK
jgi:hypothetical protein